MPKAVYVQDAHNPKRLVKMYSTRVAQQVMDTMIVGFDPSRMTALEDYILARVVAADTVITNNLYANYGDIADLMVNRLKTADLLAGAATMEYILIENQYIKLIEATRLDAEPQVQFKNYLNQDLYWTDASKISFSTYVTQWPVMVYQYDEDVKGSLGFQLNPETGFNELCFQLGEGDGVTGNSGKFFMLKENDGAKVRYYKRNTGELVEIALTDNGIVFTPYANGINLEDLKIYDDGFIAKWKGEDARTYNTTYDGNGYISKITDAETLEEITIAKISGNMP